MARRIFAVLVVGLLIWVFVLADNSDTAQGYGTIGVYDGQEVVENWLRHELASTSVYLKAVERDRTQARSLIRKPTSISRREGIRKSQGKVEEPSAETWYDLFGCETGGTFDLRAYNPAGPYFGGLQFDIPTWESVGGIGDPRDHSWETQREMGIRLWRLRGWKPWPYCAKKLRLV